MLDYLGVSIMIIHPTPPRTAGASMWICDLSACICPQGTSVYSLIQRTVHLVEHMCVHVCVGGGEGQGKGCGGRGEASLLSQHTHTDIYIY